MKQFQLLVESKWRRRIRDLTIDLYQGNLGLELAKRFDERFVDIQRPDKLMGLPPAKENSVHKTNNREIHDQLLS